MNRDNFGSVATYVIVALVLAMLTYIEFAVIEYDFPWLSRTAVMISLVVMTVVKFFLVVVFFMHLKDDDRIYSGFFSSGMILALGTFIGLAFLFTVTSVSNYTFTNVSPEVVEQETSASGAPAPVDQSQPVTAPEASDQDAFAVGEEGTVTTTVAAFDTAAAEAAYMASCSSCHQAGGTGLPGVFPPMANHADDVYNADGGREYLMHAVLFGVQGPIDVDGTTYNGAMPAWNQLSDDALAGTLNHITNAWGNDADLIDFEPYTADELAAARGAGLNPSDVHAERLALVIDTSAAPAAEEAPAEEAEPVDGEPEEAPEEAAAEPETAEAEEAEEAEEAPAAAAAGVDLAAGEVVYQSHCFACHQGTGEGLASVFPPLAGNAAELYNAEGGREYLLQAVLFGVQGPIEIDGVTYNGSMPSWTQLEDGEVADVLNYVTNAWDNDALVAGFEPYTADEIAAERPEPLSPADVHGNRPDTSAAPAEEEAAEPEAEAAAEADEAEAAETAEAAEAAEVATVEFDREAAEAAYMSSCSSCHAATGAGIPQVFPPLAGHMDDVYNADGGREYIMNVMLYGLTGSITVDGVTYGGAMPAWASLSDETLAGAYNHIVTAWGNEDSITDFEPVTPEEFAGQRGLGLSTSDVHAQREQLGLN